jgi:hypothetical protein
MPEFNVDAFKEKAGPIPVWGWVLVVVAGGYYVYKKRAASSASSAAATTTSTDTGTNTTTGGMDYGPALISAEYSLQNQLGVLDSAVGSNTSAEGANTAAVTNNNVDLGKNTLAVTGNTASQASHTKQFTVPGSFNQKVGLRDIAKAMLPPNMQKQPNAVESELRRLVSANPGLKGSSFAYGGHKLNSPS